MPNVLGRSLLFLSSYFPLAVIFYILLYQKYPLVAVPILLLGAVGTAAMIAILVDAQDTHPEWQEIAEVKRMDGDTMGYIVTYLVPFMAATSESVEQCVAYFVFFILVAFLYVNSNMIHLNPMLSLAGYHIFEVKLSEGKTAFLISRGRSSSAHKARLVKIGDDIFLEKDA